MAKDENPRDLMDYEALQQDALRGVIRSSLVRASTGNGLPGDHHFYISFRTLAAGVSIPAELQARYPDEMTIVLQNQYWDLKAGETVFSVTLQFNGQPKNLSIPYAAVSRFYDPSVQYMLQFTPAEAVQPSPVSAQSSTPAPAKPPVKAVAAEDQPKVISLDQFRRK